MNRETLATYDSSAKALAEYFTGIGSRAEDIERAIALHGKASHALNVLELGCGDGRDGSEIAKRSSNYLGIDYSESMILEAKHRHPDVRFEVGDMESYPFPGNTDIIFAFASILHVDKQGVERLFKKCYDSLALGGVLYISTKTKPAYTEDWKIDDYGKRLFYYYSSDELDQMAEGIFNNIYSEHKTIGDTDWIEKAYVVDNKRSHNNDKE